MAAPGPVAVSDDVDGATGLLRLSPVVWPSAPEAGAGHLVQAAAASRMWTPQADPSPMTWARPTLAPSIWRSLASPRRWWQTSQMLAIPVAAMGWPLDSRPPETLTGSLAVPPGGSGPEVVGSATLLAQHEVVVVDQLGGGEAVVQLDEVEVLGPDAGRLVGLLGRVPGQRVHVGQDLAGLLPRVGGEHRGADLDRAALLLERQRLALGVA